MTYLAGWKDATRSRLSRIGMAACVEEAELVRPFLQEEEGSSYGSVRCGLSFAGVANSLPTPVVLSSAEDSHTDIQLPPS